MFVRANALHRVPAVVTGVALTLCLATMVMAVDRTLGATIPKPSISGAPWTVAQRDSVQHDLNALIATAPELRGAHSAILAEDTTGVPIYARNADDVTQPASTIKLIVGSVALERLGPMFRFHTSATFEPVSLGSDPPVALRELIVRGGGDPLLRSTDLDSLVDAVATQGTTPPVGVFVDPSHFEPETYGSGWSWDDLPYAYAPPLSSSSLDENVVRLTVRPGLRIGAPALVTSTVLANHIGSCLEGCSASLHFTAEPKAVTGAMGSASTIDTFRSREGATEVVGSIALGADPQTIKVTVPAGAVFLRDVLVQRLAARGITFPSAARLDRTLDNALRSPNPKLKRERPFWVHDGEPLSDLLGDLWLPSDNLVAEMLLKEIGVAENGEPGTTDHGLAYERSWLKTLGVDPATISLDDGSGVSPYNRISARALATVLLHDWNGPYRDRILDDLPIAGVRGTTANDFKGTSSEGRLFVKTGSLTHVSGFAGYAATQCHGTVIFAFQVDDWLGDIDALNGLRARFFDRIINAPC